MTKKKKEQRIYKDTGTTLTAKQSEFARHYVATKNGTQSAIKAGYNPNSATVIASENLSKLNVREEIARLAEDNGLELQRVLAIHKRNLEQSEHLPTSQRAVNDYYELVGLKNQQATSNVNVAFIIEDK